MIPKKYLNLISWINILAGSFYLIMNLLIIIIFIFDSDFELSYSSGFRLEPIIFTILMILLVFSGYTLLNSKKKLKYKKIISFFSIIIGSFILINMAIGFVCPTAVTKINRTILVIIYLLIIFPANFMQIAVGYLLKKLIKK